MGIQIRPIALADNVAIASIIRSALKEFGADKPGTVYYDETTDHLFELFSSNQRSAYFIAEEDGVILGGAGYFHSAGLPDDTCELVKMYLTKEARGKGLGRKMIAHCLAEAKAKNFDYVYLESMPELKKAIQVYEQFGFEYLKGPMGNTGHDGCGIWMIKKIEA
ncbi:MAG: GNAT family N-acetyltransferase [Chitinophagaceae bacterium]|nr:GNAT family N-acetyltransferase [Chitinophagaceae bacterium]